MSLGTLLGGVKYLPTIVLVLTIALPITFIAMNPSGALDIVMTGGQFMMVTFIDIVKGGFAMIWWLFQALYTGIANLLIGAGNLVIGAINNFFSTILLGWKPMPTFPYLQAPEISPTIKSIVDEIMDSYTNLRLKISDYWATVQSNAPMSYVTGGIAGVGSAGATYAVLAQEASTRAISKASSETRASKSTSSTKTSRSSSSRSSSSRSSRSSSSRSSGSTQRTAKKTTKISSEQERELEQRRWQASLRRRHIK